MVPFVVYPETLRDLIARKPCRAVAEDFGKPGVLRPVCELYETEHALTEHGIRYAHCSLLDRRMGGDQRLLHFDRRDVVFIRRLRSMGTRDRPTSSRSPWQNGYAERLIGSIRRECLDHVV